MTNATRHRARAWCIETERLGRDAAKRPPLADELIERTYRAIVDV